MSYFTEFHEDAWKKVVSLGKDTGALIVVSKDPEDYVKRFDYTGFITPSLATGSIRGKKHFLIIAPKTIGQWCLSMDERSLKNEAALEYYRNLHRLLSKSVLGRLALWWVRTGVKSVKEESSSLVKEFFE